ncbi:hypothetical protein O1611_g4805 [Lasiodiplodia mahajangana]|uniref:Uncharacterized protein n=1 Tax=Lasiodiplodia mahajangana TaxID=1108764 RepID=A0ACC2JMT9_9PEZI|nr:hypothetical protein O1611_g4805 [Lasiodiplodia mahajangana]
MDNDDLPHPKKLGHDDIVALSEANGDDVPEAKFCKICAPIFSENSYDRWSRFWQVWEKIRDDPWRLGSLPRPGRHHQSLQSMKDSADQGCYICCRLILDGYSDDPGPHDYQKSFPLKYRLTKPKMVSGREAYTLQFRADYVQHGYANFSIRLMSPLLTLQQLAYRSKCRTWTGNDDTARITRFWINECLTSHKGCSKRSLDGWRPSRLLDVSEDKIKLVSGDSEEARQHPYVTLSHCWGTHQFSVLTSTSMPRYVEGVDINQFEPTFREAITTVRRVGVRYLWIDCYCIIQGSDAEAVADWKYESLRMGQVYANGLLNIGALDSDGPAQGLFKSRPYHDTNGRVTWSPTQKNGPRSFYIIPNIESKDVVSSLHQMQSSSLLRRGWVLQECILASRMLSFGTGQVFWQCSELGASEASPDGILLNASEVDARWAKLFPFWMLGDAAAIHQNGIPESRGQWMRALSTYCRSHLTYPEKDLFIALEGIVAELSKVSGGVFKYGMWDSTFLETIFYDINGNYLPATRNRAQPTWHWSSCYPEARYYDIIVLNANREVRKGRCSPMAYACMSNDCRPFPDARSKDLWPNLILIGRLIEELPNTEGHYHFDTADDKDASSGQALSHVPLIYEREPKQGQSAFSIIQGLILMQSESGAYRRVGVWRVYGKEEEEASKTFRTQILKTRPQLILLE